MVISGLIHCFNGIGCRVTDCTMLMNSTQLICEFFFANERKLNINFAYEVSSIVMKIFLEHTF